MIKSLFALSSFLLLISCKGSRPSKSINAVCIERLFPYVDTVINDKWSVRKMEPDYTKLYFYDGKVIVQQSIPTTPIEMINGKVVWQGPTTLKYNSIIFSNDAVTAIFCDSSDLKTARIVDKDSILQTQWAFGDYLGRVLNQTVCKKISKNLDNEGNLVEEFSLVGITDTTMRGTCELTFSKTKFRNIPYKLSPSLKEENEFKLIKINIITYPRSLGKGQLPIDSIQLPYTMLDLKIENQEEIKKLFDYSSEKLKQPIPKP